MSRNPRRFAPIKEAAEYAAVHPDTIRRQIARGNLVAYRLGRIIRVDLNQLDNLLARGGRHDAA